MSSASKVFVLKKATLLRGSDRMYRQLKRDERLAPEVLAAEQARRAIDHARFAMQNTVFYRDYYGAAGFTVDDLRDPAAFAELPIVEKSHVRENFAAFTSTESTPRNSKISASGGSTGEPTRLMRDLRTPTRAIEWRLFSWWGIDPSDDVAIIYRQVRTARNKALNNLQWWPSRRFQLDAYRIDDAHLDGFFAEWALVRPSLLIGYVGGVEEVARVIDVRGISLPSLTAIAVTAAPLTAARRAAIEETFAAPVYDHYRSAEIPWLAGECAQQDGLHTFADVRTVEVLDPAGRAVAPGVIGEVVATDLTNRVFPIIRYRLGDRTTPIAGPCACGVTLPRIAPVAGRVTEALRMPDGQLVAAEGLTQTFSIEPESVRQFQIHQRADYSVFIRVVVGRQSDALAAIERAISRFRLLLGDKVPITWEIVDSIPHDGGKVRYIKSDVTAA